MFALIMAVITSALVSIVMRLYNNHSGNKMLMFVSNYVTCLVCSLFFVGNWNITWSEASFPLWFGAITGVLFLVSFLFLQFNIKKNGVVLASTFMKLGLLVPIFLSIIWFKEYPSAMKIVGICLAILAIILMNVNFSRKAATPEDSTEENTKKKFNAAGLFLIALLLIGGTTDSSSTIYEHLGDASRNGFYLMIVFSFALLTSLIAFAVKHKNAKWTDVLFGIALGIVNYFTTYFLLSSLGSLPAAVVYPTYSVATIVLISVVGIFVFKEKLKINEIIGIVIILAALVLLNI